LQNLLWVYGFGLLFLAFSIPDFSTGDPGPVATAVRVVTVVALCLVYLGCSVIADARLWARWAWIGLFLALMLSTVPYAGWNFVDFSVYLSVMLATLIPWRTARWAILIWNACVLATAIFDPNMGPVILAAMGVLVGGATGGGIEAGRVRRHLGQAEQRVSALAVAAERERIARDLHDILGHSLTAISIKSALAARLAEQDPTAAVAQMTEVEQIARVALADVRATTTGLREVRLVGELASARSVLPAAGVEAVTPSAVPPMSPADSELLGYVVREAVTNVVRHAEATRCTIAVEDRAVTITDNGVGLHRSRGSGSGLAGLRRRLAQARGTLTVSPGPEGGTIVRAELGPARQPAASPLRTAGADAPAADVVTDTVAGVTR
jgi:two-component system sensor histidine kinase DesK